MQHLMDLVADNEIAAEQACRLLHDLGRKLHASNREPRDMKEADKIT